MYQKLNRRNVIRGRAGRALILAALQNTSTLTREELIRVTQLSYDQVRDQCQQLCMAGEISSTIGQRGERRYSLRKIAVVAGCVSLGLAISVTWGIGIETILYSKVSFHERLATSNPGRPLPAGFS